MRAHLFRDQDRHLIFHIVFLCRHISSGVGSDGKFSQRKGLVVIQDMILDIRLVLQISREIRAPVVCDHTVGKCKFQISVLQIMEIDLAHVKRSIGSLQHRRGKYFSHRNIDIRHTVLKNRLFLRILQPV